MSPRAADAAVRDALVDAAAKLVAEEGLGSLTTRRLAEMVGTSTTAVYTHFRGMAQLQRTLREEGFARFARLLETVDVGDDPVAELVELGSAYVVNAARNPHLYRFMFIDKPAEEDIEVGLHTFERVVDAAGRAVDSGRFRPADPRMLAMQLWVGAHGAVTLTLAGLMTFERASELVQETGLSLFLGFGDEPAAVQASFDRVRERRRAASAQKKRPKRS